MGKINWSGTTGLGKISIARNSKGLPVGNLPIYLGEQFYNWKMKDVHSVQSVIL